VLIRVIVSSMFSLLVMMSSVSAEMFQWPAVTASVKWAAARYEVDERILNAIREVESKGNPYAFNLQAYITLDKKLDNLGVEYIAGDWKNRKMYSVFPETKQQAVRVVQQIIPHCMSYDIGWFQISKGKIEDNHIKLEDLLIPQYNAAWGAKIFHDCVKKENTLWKAVECYHRGSSRERITSYSHLVYQSYLAQP